MRRYLRTFLVLGLTVLLLLLFLQQANLAQVVREIGNANITDLVLAVLSTLFIYVFRTVRWRAMLDPIGRTHFVPAFRATVIGFAANALLPARAGEFLRPYILARREGLRATATFATIILERLLDLLTVLLLFASYVLFFSPSTTGANAGTYAAVKAGGAATAAIALVILLVLFVLAGHPDRLGRLVERAERLLPARIAHFIASLARTFAQGLAVMRQTGPLARAVAWSFPVWFSIATGIWLTSRAFGIEMSYTGSFLMIALLTVGVAVPTPGAVGGFHYAFRIGATTFFAAPNERAVGAGIILHAISFVPVAVLGVIFMLREGLSLTGVRSLPGTPMTDEQPEDARRGTERGDEVRRARSSISGRVESQGPAA